MKSIFRWLTLFCLCAVTIQAAPPPHPTRLNIVYKDRPQPVLRVEGSDPVALIDGHEQLIKQRITYYPERAPAFGANHVEVAFHFLHSNPNRVIRIDMKARSLLVKMTLKSEADLSGAFLLVSATIPQTERDKDHWPKTFFLARELPELKAGIATRVEEALVLIDVVPDMDCFVQLFDAQGREITTNVMQPAWAYYHAQEVHQLQEATPDYLKKFAGQSREVFPVVHPSPYFPDKDDARPESALVRMTISAEGRVTEASVEGVTDPATSSAVHDAFMGWLFFPRLRDGVPVEAVVEVPVKFH